MRTTVASALIVVTSSLAEPPPPRYLVIPTGHEAPTWTGCRPALSANGRVVAFEANTALDPNDRNETTDIYVLDRTTRRLTLVSKTPAGAAGRGPSRCPSLSADGRRLVFESDAADLIGDERPSAPMVLFADLERGTIRRLSERLDLESWPSHAAISADGQTAVFQIRTVGEARQAPAHVFRSNLEVDTSAEDLGEGFAPTVSGDGRTIAFRAIVPGGMGAGLFVITDGVRRQVAQGAPDRADARVDAAMLSSSGEWIAFTSRATDLMGGRRLSGRSHVYLEHVRDGHRHLVSATPEGVEGNGHSGLPSVDAAAARVVFQSTATNLPCGRPRRECAEDINLVSDIFVWARDVRAVARVNVATSTVPWLGASTAPVISADGRVIAFYSCQPVSDADGRGTFDLFVVGP